MEDGGGEEHTHKHTTSNQLSGAPGEFATQMFLLFVYSFIYFCI